MTAVTFTIPGEPVAKGRPRATSIAGRARLYTPAKTARYESTVALFASQAMAGRALLDEALEVWIDVHLPVPASWSRTKRDAALSGRLRPASRPDADNIAKAVTDGCNGVVWTDDSRIVEMHIAKRYALEPRVAVCVTLASAPPDLLLAPA